MGESAARTADAESGFSPVVELRQYTLHPGGRDVLVELFERELIEPQEELGMEVIGQFVDRADPDRFVWLRGYVDMRTRREALAAFYDGPVWKEHRVAANATMIDSDDVLLLRPARGDSAFRLDDRRAADAGARGAVAATIAYLESADTEPAVVEAFESTIAPGVAARGGTVLGYFVTEPSRNDYPRLPVREGERVVVWFTGLADSACLDRDESLREAADALDPLRAVRRLEQLTLLPTARSRLTGRSAPCRATEARAITAVART